MRAEINVLCRRDVEEGLLKKTKKTVIWGLRNLNSTIWNSKENKHHLHCCSLIMPVQLKKKGAATNQIDGF